MGDPASRSKQFIMNVHRRYDRVIDVGGAYGSLLASVLEANTMAKGVLFDLPQVRPTQA